MKKKIVSAVFIVAIVIAAGYTMQQSIEKENITDFILSNVEALAQKEGSDGKCWLCSHCYSCTPEGNSTGCAPCDDPQYW